MMEKPKNESQNEKLINQYKESIPLKPVSDKKIRDDSSEQLSARDDRDRTYSNFLKTYHEHYLNKSRQNRKMKIAFFVLTFSILIVSLIVLSVIGVKIAMRGGENLKDLIALVSCFGTLLAAILVLPKIIGKYLFPPKEDKEILELIRFMRDADEHSEHE